MKRLIGFIVILSVFFCLAGSVAEQVSAGPTPIPVQVQVVPGNTTGTLTVVCNQHSWKLESTTTQPTCTKEGRGVYKCSVCGSVDRDRAVPALGHKAGSSRVKTEATCKTAGVKVVTCERCGADIKEEAIPKGAHKWGSFRVTKEPTCSARGKRTAKCEVCGETTTKSIATIDHTWGDWEVTKEATDHSKGKRSHACTECGHKESEEYYPDGTIYKGLGCSASEIKELQAALKEHGFYGKKKLSGEYDSETVSAVKKFQRKMGKKADGIGWPETIMLLGLHVKPGEPIMPDDLSEYKLQLTVTQTSPVETAYHEGDTLTFEWVLTDASTKDATDAKVSVFNALATKTKSKGEKVIGGPVDIAAGASATGTYEYTVTKKDVLAGSFTIGFIGRGKIAKKSVESNTVAFKHSATAGTGVSSGAWVPPTDTKANELTVTKTVVNTPKNKLHFEKGESITFRITVTNPGKTAVKDVIVTDAMFPALKGKVGTLAPGKSWKTEQTVKVTAADVGKGSVTNKVVVSYKKADGTLGEQHAEATALTGLPVDGLVVHKVVKNAPANGLFYIPGEEIEFEITVTNPTKSTISKISVSDKLISSKYLNTEKSLDAGKSMVLTGKIKVTELQAKAGKIVNVVSVQFMHPKTGRLHIISNACTVPTGFKGQDGIIIEKSIISKPKNGKYYKEGEEIRFQIDVTNNTVEDIAAMDIRDILVELDKNGHRTLKEAVPLKSMETFTIHLSYTVEEADVKATKVINQASIVYKPDGKTELELFSNVVEAPTAKTVIARKPKAPKLKGKACETVLTAAGEGVAWHDLTECTEHTVTAEKAGELLSDGDYDKAGELWSDDIDDLYSEWITGEDTYGRIVVENDQAAFNRQLDAWETSMALLYDDESDTVARLVTEEKMNKTVNMCYELHAAPETRPDSLSGKHSRLDAAETEIECERTVSYDKKGAAHYVDCQCETHMLTAQLTDFLLQTAEDDADRTVAWQRAQANWLLELNAMYDTWYLSADEADRDLIAADRIAFDEAIAARKEALDELYADKPAIAAEVLSNMIMTRTQTVCQALHEAGILVD